MYKGRDYGARLQRNFKGYKEWLDVNASDVVTEVATDLGLGTSKIETDTTQVNLVIDIDRHDSYFNIMKAVSDYWLDAATQIKKDFCVDASSDLVWKNRPWRTSGVESISLTDMVAYGLLRDIQSVKNWIHVYGAKEKAWPSDRDAFTDLQYPSVKSSLDADAAIGQKVVSVVDASIFSVNDPVLIIDTTGEEENAIESINLTLNDLTMKNNLTRAYLVGSNAFVLSLPGWYSVTGNADVYGDSTDKIVGSYSVRHTNTVADYYGRMMLHLPTLETDYRVSANHYPSFNFQIMINTGQNYSGDGTLILKDGDGNTAAKQFSVSVKSKKWYFQTFPCGKKFMDQWQIIGSFDWSKVKKIDITAYFDGTGWGSWWIDNFFFNNRNFYGFASDPSSYGDCGYADLVHIDEVLHSDSDCEKRAKALCYQKSGVPYRLDFQVAGNPNILIGDRIPITIDPDDLTSVNFDVLSVEQVLSGDPVGWRTNVVTLNTADLRTPPATTMPEFLIREKLENLLVAKGRLIVR